MSIAIREADDKYPDKDMGKRDVRRENYVRNFMRGYEVTMYETRGGI